MESNRRNFLFCPWCTASFFLSSFSPKRNGYGDRVSGIYKLVDTVPPSVDTGCFPWILTKPEMNLSAMSMFLSLDMFSARICLFSGSMATYPKPDILRTSLDQCFIYNVFCDPFSLWWYPFWMILLNPVPNRNMISFENIR